MSRPFNSSEPGVNGHQASPTRGPSLPRWIGQQWQLARPYGKFLYYQLFPRQRPEYFRAAWNYRSFPLAQAGGALAEWRQKAAQRTAFVVLPMVDWHGRFQRTQQLTRALADLGHPCLYVNPQLGCEYFLPFAAAPESRVAHIAPSVAELHVHLPREHDSHSRMLLESETARVVEAVETALTMAGVTDAVQLVSFPRWAAVARRLREQTGAPILYDSHDHLSGLGRIGSDILASEEALLGMADQILVSSQLLEEQAARHPGVEATSVRMVRNGANFADFEAARQARARALPEAATFGYVGALNHWFDTELLAAVARSRPQYRFELAGTIEHRSFEKLQNVPNVHCIGEVPYRALPELFGKWRAGLIPFRRNTLTDATDPIKLYEYLSAGLPVVSTPLPEVLRHGALVQVAAGAGEFAEALDRSIESQDEQQAALRFTRSRAESWISRAREVVAAAAAAASRGDAVASRS